MSVAPRAIAMPPSSASSLSTPRASVQALEQRGPRAALVARIFTCALADLRERSRRGSFLGFLLATIGFGWLGFAGHIEMRLGGARGVLDSAWIGTLMAIGTSFFLTMVGFYVVKSSIAFDRRSGVGEIIAATPLPSAAYLLSKWLANAALFASAVAVLAAASVLLQLQQGEENLELFALLWPTLLLTIPAALAVAAFAVLFETVPLLRGGFGNVVWFFFWSLGFAVAMLTNGALDWIGMGVVKQDLERDFALATGATDATLSYTIGGGTLGGAESSFHWNGLEADLATIGPRLGVIGCAALLALLGTLWFDRFARPTLQARATRRRSQPIEAPAWNGDTAGSRTTTQALFATRDWANPPRRRWGFGLLRAELRLALTTLPRPLALLALVPAVGAAIAGEAAVGFATAAALAPVLIWSKLGNRERFHGVDQVVFASPRPIARQLLASWGAGVVIAALALGPWIVRLLLAGDLHRVLVASAGLAFVPALALACGVWSGSSRLFEALFVALWYAGPANKVATLDWVGVTHDGSALVLVVSAMTLLSLAALGRYRQNAG